MQPSSLLFYYTPLLSPIPYPALPHSLTQPKSPCEIRLERLRKRMRQLEQENLQSPIPSHPIRVWPFLCGPPTLLPWSSLLCAFSPQPKSLYEIRLERLRKRMRQLEQENLHVEARHWTMRGEVTAGSRPKNSALAADLDFEHAARPPPVITEEVTQTIEEIIKRRILNQQFDDVERKAKPVATPVKGRLELDDNPSAQGLAEIYEAQFLKAAGQAQEGMSATEQIKHEAARMFKHLCTKLDALSHFHFAPKPIMDVVDVTANVPAIAMEEVAPVAVSTASMLAPEEVFAGGEEGVGAGGGRRGSARGMVKGEGEMEREDRKRLRSKLKRKWKGEKAEDQKSAPAVPGAASSAAGGAGAAAGGGGRKIRVVERGQQKHGLSDFTNSAKVFTHIQDIRASGNKKQRAEAPSQHEPQQIRAAALKL
ncbi:unnamed protein product [Closterium sp. Yama58-4]|nr:unnamed protein product [Closterium sp. Yama58-4]